MHIMTLIALLTSTASAQSSCFTPSGLDANNLTGTAASDESPIYLPCNTSQPVSMCCALGNANASLNEQCVVGSDGQYMGLCFAPLTQSYSRESCSDQTWQSPSCVKLFTDIHASSSTPDVATEVPVTFCSSTDTFCPGSGNSSCCASRQGVILNANGTTSPILRPSAPKHNTTATDLALLFGGGGGVLLIAGLLVWLGVRSKRRKAKTNALETKIADAERYSGREFVAPVGMGVAGYDARRTVMNVGTNGYGGGPYARM